MENRKENKSKAQVVSEAICGAIMLIAILAYVLLGIFANFWHPGWVIIVACAVVCGITGLVVNTVCDLKNINQTENPNEQD